MSRTRKSLLTVLALAMLNRPVNLLLSAMLPDMAVNPVPRCVAGILVSLLLLGLPAWRMRPWTSVRLTRAQSLWPGLLMAVAGALLAREALSPVDAAWQGWMHLAPDSLPAPMGISLLLYAAALAVVPALAEEAFFRGAFLMSLLDGSRRTTAVLLTTAAFALMHGRAANLPSLLVVSLLLTVLMLHTGHIAVPITAHLVYNLTALRGSGMPLWGSLLCGVLLAALVMMLWVRQPNMAHPPMKRLDVLLAAAVLIVLATLYFF
ncbi:MAG: type II CAAX prenyl endopeptidase Rce1 family protein [Aristaeellaceae bacterium]